MKLVATITLVSVTAIAMVSCKTTSESSTPSAEDLEMVQQAKQDMSVLTMALLEYSIVNGGRYPDSMEVLVTPDSNGHSYLKQRNLPSDPWGNVYVYEAPEHATAKPHIMSYGRDGVPGGVGIDADVTNQD